MQFLKGCFQPYVYIGKVHFNVCKVGLVYLKPDLPLLFHVEYSKGYLVA